MAEEKPAQGASWYVAASLCDLIINAAFMPCRTKGLVLSKSGPARTVHEVDPELALGRFQMSVPAREKRSLSNEAILADRPVIPTPQSPSELPPLVSDGAGTVAGVAGATNAPKPQGRFPAWSGKKLVGVARMQLSQQQQQPGGGRFSA